MRKLAFAALAAVVLLCPLPAAAQYVDGTLTTSGTDVVTLDIPGWKFATAKFRVRSAGTATATLLVSNDGANFTAAPFAKRITTVTANPTTQAIATTTLVTGDVWEVALPANATQVQLSCAGSGTTTSVSIYGGAAYVPGATITAVLFDTTSAVNTAIDTGTMDMSGWEFISASYNTPAGGSGTISMVDDAGTSVTMFTVPASAIAWYPFAVASPSVTQVTALPTTGATGALPIQKRMRFQSAGVAALTSRVRVEARR